MLSCKLVVLIVASLVLNSSCEEDIVQELTNRFNDVSTECLDSRGVAKPLYECSGIIIRGIKFDRNEKRFAWTIKASDQEKKSFPFGFLRHDHPFSRLGRGYDAGFILYPHSKTPTTKIAQKVLCAFPIDAMTDMRGDRGCGPNRNDVSGVSRQCDLQNITTFTDWLAHFKQIVTSENPQFPEVATRQCGFDTTNEETAINNFAVAMEANAYLQNGYYPRLTFQNSEIRLEAWDENSPKQLPIQSFFYFVDTKNGLENATKFRDDYYTETGGEKVPIVGIRLPTASNPNIHIEAAEN